MYEYFIDYGEKKKFKIEYILKYYNRCCGSNL